jgi:alkaline phosphatase
MLLASCLLLWLGASARADRLHDLQAEAEQSDSADWGHWGPKPQVYRGSNSHSNRLIPVYTFGIQLSDYTGEKSAYRNAAALRKIYGYVPDHTVNPTADYCDQSDIYRLQQDAVAAGKKYIFLIVFDGMDWELTRAAAHYYHPELLYTEGRGRGLGFLEYEAPVGDFGFCVTSPTNSQAKVDVNTQQVENAAIGVAGGYDPAIGGRTPWSKPTDLAYLLGRNKQRPHAVADSSCTAATLTTGKKSYNGAINFDSLGRQSTPIAVELQAKGWRVGAVTSVPVPHATPGASYANNVTRQDYQDISRDMLGQKSASHPREPLSGLDVAIGTGWGIKSKADGGQGKNFLPGNKYVHESTIEAIDVANGGKYVVAQRTAGQPGGEWLLAKAAEAARSNQRLFGFFGTSADSLPFATADGKFDPVVMEKQAAAVGASPALFSSPKDAYSPAELTENPTLADMARAALIVLSAKPEKPFWLMVEAGDVDWAAHKNNIDNAIGAVHSGDAAFRVVVDWIEEHHAWDDSAVILTADHGHLFVPTKLEELKP